MNLWEAQLGEMQEKDIEQVKEDYIEIYGSIEDDMWTVRKRENCNFWEW